MLAVKIAPFWLGGLWPGPSTPGVSFVFLGVDSFIANITAALDAGQAFGVDHNLGGPFQEFWLIPLLSQFWLSEWFVAASVVNVITVTKIGAAGSGSASPQVQLVARRPHTVGR